jgi:microcystin-dependent protein
VTPPASWALIDGSAVSRTLYPQLFTLIGTTYGAGDGSTTFNLPDLRNKFILNYGSAAGFTARNLGDTGGEENHVLSIAELAVHTHIQNAHAHTVNNSPVNTTGILPIAGSQTWTVANVNTTSVAAINQNTGGGAGHNTMPPFLCLVYIIKMSPTGGPTAQAPIADTTQAGLLNPVSGNATDYVGGDNASHPLIVPTIEYYDQDDFITINGGPNANTNYSKLFIVSSSGGAGAIITLSKGNYLGHSGVLQLGPGTTASSYVRAILNNWLYLDGNMTITIQGVMTVGSGSFAGTNQYFFGLTNSGGPLIAAANSYAGFFAAANSNANWQLYTRNAATVVATPTTVPVGNQAWHKFKIVATLSQVSFYIDDVLMGTVTDSSVPPGTTDLYTAFFTNNGSGTSNFSLIVDCFDIWLQPVAQSGQPATRFMRSIL